MTLFIALGIVLTVLAAGLIIVPLLRSRDEHNAPVAAVVTALLIPAAVISLYLTATNHDWLGTADESRPERAEMAPAPELDLAITQLTARLEQAPEDIEGWLLLGRSLVEVRRYEEAEAAFGNAMALTNGENTQAKLGFAEVRMLTDQNAARGEAGQLIEEVLAVEPDNPKALWYGGIVALARDDNEAVRRRWGKLLEFSPPPAVRKIIEQQLAATGQPAGTKANEKPVANGIAIEVTISVADELKGDIRPNVPLFLVARSEAAGGPPVAVVRHVLTSLPTTLSISDANAMVPGRSLADLEKVKLIARVANGGDPVAKPGDIYGEAIWSGNLNEQSLMIVMDKTFTE
jgi:cytochrome c-type biogenesis protein CcmH